MPATAVAATLGDAPDRAGSGALPLRGLDLDAVTIPQVQEQMDAGALSSVELTGVYLDRIDALNDDLGAVLSVDPEALDDAAASDAARGQQGARSPLEGIPVLLTDNVDTDQMPTTAGSRALLDSEPGYLPTVGADQPPAEPAP